MEYETTHIGLQGAQIDYDDDEAQYYLHLHFDIGQAQIPLQDLQDIRAISGTLQVFDPPEQAPQAADE